jgi:hypothetical protein
MALIASDVHLARAPGEVFPSVVLIRVQAGRGFGVRDVACQRDGLWREFCDQVTVGDCWRGRTRAGRCRALAGNRRILKITIWGAGGVLPPMCNEAPVGRG